MKMLDTVYYVCHNFIYRLCCINPNEVMAFFSISQDAEVLFFKVIQGPLRFALIQNLRGCLQKDDQVWLWIKPVQQRGMNSGTKWHMFILIAKVVCSIVK